MTTPLSPRYRLPYGDLDAALARLDTIIFGGWSPRLAGMVAATRTFAYHGGYNADGSVTPDGEIIIPDDSTAYVQRTLDGTVSADAALDPAKIPMATATAASGVLTAFNDIREIQMGALLALFSGATGDLVYGDAAGGPQVLPIGTEGQALLALSGVPQWGDIGGTEADVLTITEERPTTPSPYDDEFDGTGTVDAKWTQTSGSSSDYEMRHSRLLAKTSTRVSLKQTPAYLTNPLRIRVGFQGWAVAGGYAGMGILLQGATKGMYVSIDDNNSSTSRRICVQRMSSSSVYEADLNTNAYDTADGQTARSNHYLDVTLLIDATYVTVYLGPPGSPKSIYQYARSNLGTLSFLQVQLDEGTSLRYFRMDKVTTPYAFNLDWAP